MQWTLQRKVSVGLVGAAVAALAIDSGLVFSGGSDAAAAVETVAPDAEELIAAAPAAPTGPTLASKLEAISGEMERRAGLPDNAPGGAGDLDGPLATPESWPVVEADKPTHAPAPLGTFRLSSVMAGGAGRGYAVINGTLVQVGAEIDGATLVSVSTEHAVLQTENGELRLMIDE